jgi:hypothetical protein
MAITGLLLAAAPAVVAQLSAVELFDLADAARAAGRLDNAAVIYAALAKNPDPTIRVEARFRLGVMWANAGRPRDAATALRAALDEAPNAAAIRIELAQALVAIGDEAAAQRELRQAAALGLPAEMADELDRFARALRSTAKAGGGVEVSFAPDTNINRATNARTLDTVLATLLLSEDARAQSGLGVAGSANGFLRLPVAPGLSLLPRVAGAGTVYGRSQFNDVAASVLVGLEWRTSAGRFSPSIGHTWRWFGGQLLADTSTAAIDWLRPLSATRQIVMSGSAAAAHFPRNPAQNGGLFDANITLEQALSARAGLAFTAGATRQTARDPGFAAWSAGGSVQLWRDAGRTTWFGTAALRHTWGDAPLLLLPEPRREWQLSAKVGARLRGLQVAGFAPVLRVGFERNFANNALFDYHLLVIETGLARAW